MSSDTGRLRSGVSLIQVSSRSIATVAGLTMNMWARPDLDRSQQEKPDQKRNILTHPYPRADLGKGCPFPLTECDPLSCLHRNVPSLSERSISATFVMGQWGHKHIRART